MALAPLYDDLRPMGVHINHLTWGPKAPSNLSIRWINGTGSEDSSHGAHGVVNYTTLEKHMKKQKHIYSGRNTMS